MSVEASRTSAAAPTAYASSLPEAGIAWTDSDERPRRVGVWVPVQKNAWQDAGVIAEMVRALLEDDLLREVDEQVLAGDGTGENLNGIMNASITSQALGADTHGQALVKAATTIRSGGNVGPIDVVANAADLQDAALSTGFRDHLEVLRDVFGVRDFIASPVASTGTVLVGDFSGAHLYVRQGVSISVSDSHSTFFLEGKVAVAAETRLESKVVRASAFVKITGA